ncbi:hypothetical protein KC19_VG264800 [Ceratodon purpureus]|uniref:Uncharacterized protein n=1 Tax=Ceratodon purpureus TaxID=3225 RepID=A0A8T0HTW0_CERPU|nr:hypothetical protein KC19_VG264800 [Ceratodon purpureus]
MFLSFLTRLLSLVLGHDLVLPFLETVVLANASFHALVPISSFPISCFTDFPL